MLLQPLLDLAQCWAFLHVLKDNFMPLLHLLLMLQLFASLDRNALKAQQTCNARDTCNIDKHLPNRMVSSWLERMRAFLEPI